MATWNPPPPEPQEDAPADLKNDDRIGDTVLSEAWVLSVIVKLVSSVEDDEEKTKNYDKDSPQTSSGFVGSEEREAVTLSAVGSETVKTVTDLPQDTIRPLQAVRGDQYCTGPAVDKGLETDMCKLWDISSNMV